MSALVQSTGQQSSGSVASVAKAFASNVTAGNSIIVKVASANTTWPTTGGVTDSLGNTYTRDVLHFAGAGQGAGLAIYRCHNVTGGACTVTADCGTDFMSMAIEEWSGLNNAAPTNTASAGPTNGTAVSSGTLGAAASAGVVVGFMSHDGTTSPTITPGGSFSQSFEAESATNQPVNAEYQVVAAGTYSATWTLSTAQNWHAAAAYYANAAAPAAADTPLVPLARNNQVGSMAQRFARRSAAPLDLAQAPATDTNFSARVDLPHNRVGPVALRRLYRAPAYPFDSTVSTGTTTNRLRRVICAGA